MTTLRGPSLLALAALLGTVPGSTSPDGFRPLDGGGSHAMHPEWGAAGSALLRRAPVGYDDGVAEPRARDAGPLPNPRTVSNRVAAQEFPVPEGSGITDFLWVWGQFVDHDITLVPQAEPEEPFLVKIPTGDPVFDPGATGEHWMPFTRSAWDPASGTGRRAPRQQVNALTAYLDASAVYGSDPQRAAALRRDDGTGRLRTSRGRMLPLNRRDLAGLSGDDPRLYVAGDVRANEHVALTVIHTLMVREHNRFVVDLRRREPDLDGEGLYQRARAWVGALMQVITYREFLPLVLGPDALPPYRGYRPGVDPGIANEFATVAFRFGHSMVSPVLRRLDHHGETIPEGDLPLRRAFFAPHELDPKMGIEPYLRGLARQGAQRLDPLVIDDLRNLLFGPPGAGGLDLATLNIQRGRDHGMPGYNDVRRAYDLPPRRTWEAVTSDPALGATLAELYGHPDRMDAWVGGLAEDRVDGALVGELVHTVLVDQFTRLRDGDPWWWERSFPGAAGRHLTETRLSDVMRRNARLNERQIADDVFRLPPGSRGPRPGS